MAQPGNGWAFFFGGNIMAVTVNPSATELKRAKARAAEWRQFRRNFLYSQLALAEALQISRRSVVAVETGREVITPHPDTLRAFRELKRKLETQFGKREVA